MAAGSSTETAAAGRGPDTAAAGSGPETAAARCRLVIEGVWQQEQHLVQLSGKAANAPVMAMYLDRIRGRTG